MEENSSVIKYIGITVISGAAGLGIAWFLSPNSKIKIGAAAVSAFLGLAGARMICK